MRTFLELNAKHVHIPKNVGITIRISDDLWACICLPNTYTSHTQHIHILCTKARICASFCSISKGIRRTTHVYVVYVFDKHVHVLNLLTISIVRGNFPECVRVWRLILKKSPRLESEAILEPYACKSSE